MLFRVIISLVALLSFLFFLWRRLREDYSQNQVFSIGFYSLLASAVASVIADSFFPLYWFWFSFAAYLAGMFIGIIRYKLRIFEAIEAFVYAGLILLAWILLYDWWISKVPFSGASVIVIIGLIVLFEILDRHYKRFAWYKSGKVGFSGLTIVGIFFLVRSMVALFKPDMISFVGQFEVVLSGVTAFTAFLLVFNLSRQTT